MASTRKVQVVVLALRRHKRRLVATSDPRRDPLQLVAVGPPSRLGAEGPEAEARHVPLATAHP